MSITWHDELEGALKVQEDDVAALDVDDLKHEISVLRAALRRHEADPVGGETLAVTLLVSSIMCLAASLGFDGFVLAAIGLAGASAAVWQRVGRIRARMPLR